MDAELNFIKESIVSRNRGAIWVISLVTVISMILAFLENSLSSKIGLGIMVLFSIVLFLKQKKLYEKVMSVEFSSPKSKQDVLVISKIVNEDKSLNLNISYYIILYIGSLLLTNGFVSGSSSFYMIVLTQLVVFGIIYYSQILKYKNLYHSVFCSLNEWKRA